MAVTGYCPEGDGEPTVVEGTDCVDVTGTGPAADPYTVAAVTDPDAAMACGPNGLQAVISGDDTNQVEYGSDGGLFVPPEMRFARLQCGSDITAPSNTDTHITWTGGANSDGIVNNKYGWASNAFGVVVPVTGVYRVTLRLQMNGFAGAVDDVIATRVARTASGDNTIERRPAGIDNPYYPSIAILHGQAGETFSGIVGHTGAGDRTILAGTQITVELIQIGQD